MRYTVQGWCDERRTGKLKVDAETRPDALEKALALKGQGIGGHVSIADETGREFSLNEFSIFCAEEE